MVCLSNALSNCFQTVTSCFTSCFLPGMEDEDEVLLEEGSKGSPLTPPSQAPRMVDREVSPIVLSPGHEGEVPKATPQIIEGAPQAFYIGVYTPGSVVSQARQALHPDILSQMKPVKHPHTTLVPPSDRLNPGVTVNQNTTSQRSLKVDFQYITISPRGTVSMVGDTTPGYKEFNAGMAESFGAEAQSRDPHSCIGMISQDQAKEIYANPEKYGFVLVNNPQEQGFGFERSGILALRLPTPCSMEIEVAEEEVPPKQQQLLAIEYGAGVEADKPLERDYELEARFSERHQEIVALQVIVIGELGQGSIPRCPKYKDPVQFNHIAIIIAVEGHRQYGRVPLTFSLARECLMEGLELWAHFRGDVSNTLVGHGYVDADVSVLGSGVSGYSGNPNKDLKAWTRNSDTDCAIFSTSLAAEAAERGVAVNPKIYMLGRYTVFKNGAAGVQAGFESLPVGQAFKALQLRWTRELYGEPGEYKPQLPGRELEIIEESEVDFKLNIGDRPFGGKAITFRAADYASSCALI